jgi:hypothetical protein
MNDKEQIKLLGGFVLGVIFSGVTISIAIYSGNIP